MTTKAKIFRDTITVNSASMIEKVFFFVINIIIARYLSVEHFGEYSTALSYATFFSFLTDIGINGALIRALNLEKQYENEHFTNAFYLKISLSVIVYSLMAFSLFWTGYNRDVINLTLILGLVRIGNEFMRTYYAVDEARQQFIFPSVVNSIYVLLFFAGVVAVILFKGNYYHICLVRLVVVYFFIFFLTANIFKKIKFTFKKNLCKSFIKQVVPFAIISVLSNLTFIINPIIISFILGTTKVGFFNNSIVFIDTLAIIPINLRRILMPALYTALEEKDESKFQFSFDIMSKYFGIVSFYIMLILFLYSDFIVTLIFGKKYIESAYILKILSLATPFLFNIASIILTGKDRQDIFARIMIVATIVNIFANIIFIHLFDVKGAAIAVVLIYALIFFMSHYYLRKLEKIKMVPAFRKYLHMGAIVFVSCLLFEILSYKNLNIYSLFIVVTLTYGLLSIAFLMDRDDLRIIKQTVGLKS